MRQMKYIKKGLTDPIILDSGFYRGYEYYILSLGTHPTAYVVLEEGNIFYKKHYDDIDISCHGGLTYSSSCLKNLVKNKWVIGWDYAHGDDYTGYLEILEEKPVNLKRWTTSEIYKGVKFVIHQIIIKNGG